MSADYIQDITLAGAKMGMHPHICAFFHSQDEEYQIMLPFIKEGIERGEKAFHVVDPDLQADHLQRLRNVGLDPAELELQKQLEVRVWEQAYLRSDGSFSMDDMLRLVQEIITDARRDGFPRARLIAHMEWSLKNRPGVEDIIEYESRLNQILPQFHDPLICIYDLAQYNAATIIEILRTHPMVIIGGILQENPFYIQPDDYLKELQARKA